MPGPALAARRTAPSALSCFLRVPSSLSRFRAPLSRSRAPLPRSRSPLSARRTFRAQTHRLRMRLGAEAAFHRREAPHRLPGTTP